MKLLRPLTLVMAGMILIAATIDYDALFDYEGLTVPSYVNKDNTDLNTITNEGATLGRVLFYDKNLSRNNTIACASCHLQEFGFSDTAVASVGVSGATPRHSMRLINARFADEEAAFWDERAETFEAQASMPIQDHIEMGFGGTDGDPDLDSLFRKLAAFDHYQRLFTMAFGDAAITETRIQNALAQFVRSIQSFDARYDDGRARVANDRQPFPNFTDQENAGKNLFLAPPQFDPEGRRIGGGAGCAGCHRPPEFDIDPNSRNNGLTIAIDGGRELDITRAPSLRDLVNPDGLLNGPMMHTGSITDLEGVLDHYDVITRNPNLDRRLNPGGNPQQLNLTEQERSDMIAFMGTLTGRAVYTAEQWSDPFDDEGNLVITSVREEPTPINVSVYPNPAVDVVTVRCEDALGAEIVVYSINGRELMRKQMTGATGILSLGQLGSGMYLVGLQRANGWVPVSVTPVVVR